MTDSSGLEKLKALVASFGDEDGANDTQISNDGTYYTATEGRRTTNNFVFNESDIYDPAFGISIRNPKVELKVFNTHCWGFRKFKLTQLYPDKPPQNEWVTMGVIVDKTEERKSANNNSYMIWQLHDLHNCQIPAVKVLLFGDCLKEHWKLQPGMVVAITQAQYGEGGKENKNVVTLKLTKAVQIIALGFCPDFGHCKGIKNDSMPCSNFVNTSKSSHCAYHVQQSAKLLAGRRGAFNTSYSQQPKNLDISVPRSLAQPSGLLTVNQAAFNQNTVQTGSSVRATANKVMANPCEIKQDEKNHLTTLLQSNPTLIGARNLIKMQNKSIMPFNKRAPNAFGKSMKDFINDQFPKNTRPKNDQIVDLSKPSLTLSQKEKLARQNAAAVMQKPGLNTNSASKKRPFTLSIEPGDQQPTTSNEQQAKKSRLGGGFTDEQIRKLLEKKSSHEKEADAEDRRREDHYFTGMESKEKVETHLNSMMEIKNVKVVTCKKCKYTSEKQSSLCKINGHLVHIHKADKRWYRCKDCRQRTITFELMPSNPCKSCNGNNFERVSMRDERKIVADGEKLLIRGIEEKYLN